MIGDKIDDIIFWFDWNWLHCIPFPRWPKFIKYDGAWYSLQEWFGDLGCLLMVLVWTPILKLSFNSLPHDWSGWTELGVDDGNNGSKGNGKN